MSTCSKFRIGRVGALIAIALTALVAAFALSSVTDAAAQLSFDDVPSGWSVTSGEADDHVGAIQASGLKKQNRIRYSLVGPDGFSIKPRTGIVQYDGTAIESDSALLVVTATDRQGKASEASAAITVSVARGAPVALDEAKIPAQTDPTPGLVVAANALASVADAVAQAAAAQAPAETNREPQFAGDVAVRTLPENSPAGTLLGEPVTATDADHDGLTYSLSGSDAFTIEGAGGQISVASGALLDYETQPAYTLTVGVSDGKNATGQPDASVDDTIQVVVSLTDVNEAEPVQQVERVEPPSLPHERNENHAHSNGPHKFAGGLSGFDFKATPGDKHIRLSWNRPSNKYSTITKYQYCSTTCNPYDPPNDPKWKNVPSGSSATGYRVGDPENGTELENGTEYTFKIRTVFEGEVQWTSGAVKAYATAQTMYQVRFVRLFAHDLDPPRYVWTVRPTSRVPAVGEGRSASAVAYFETSHHQARWSLDSKGKWCGFYFEQVEWNRSPRPFYHNYTNTKERLIALSYDGQSWETRPQCKTDGGYTITVTATHEEEESMIPMKLTLNIALIE